MDFHKFLRIYSNDKTKEIQLLVYYRYLSLAIISFFYLVGELNHPIQRKLFIIICISISACILNYLYIKNQRDKQKIKLLIFIETMGNCFLLIPSGGIHSPYIWYMLNTIILSAMKINKSFCFLNITSYGVITFLIIAISEDILFMDILNRFTSQTNLNLTMSFALITMAIMYLSDLIKDLQRKSESIMNANTHLELANKKIKDSIDHIKALYQAVHTLSLNKSEEDIMEIFVHYARIITKADKVFFINTIDHKNTIILERKEERLAYEDILKKEILNSWNNIIANKIPIKIGIKDKKYIVALVESSHKIYGVLGIEETPQNKDYMENDCMEQVQFLAELGSITLERPYLEKVNERLVISQEQNRIANEIHDSVLQRLFSMSMGIYTLIMNTEKLNNEQLKEELDLIRKTMDNTMKELRSTIYGLSSQKNGHNTFHEDIINYIKEVREMNNINIEYEVQGSIDGLPIAHKKAMYRIICEGISNSIRHGKSSEIKVGLNTKDRIIFLEIIDDGIGFEIDEIQNLKEGGLGLKNIRNLANSLNGDADITSKVGDGTNILVTIPKGVPVLIKEEAV